MSKKKLADDKNKKSSGSFKTFLLSVFISILLIAAISAIVLFVLYPNELITDPHLYDICVNLVLFFSVVFVVSIAAIWINSKDLETVEESDEFSLFEKCDYTSSMTNQKPFMDEDDSFSLEIQPLGSKLNELWEEYEEAFIISSDTVREKTIDAFADASLIDVAELSDEYSYNFDKPFGATSVVTIDRYKPFPEKEVRPFMRLDEYYDLEGAGGGDKSGFEYSEPSVYDNFGTVSTDDADDKEFSADVDYDEEDYSSEYKKSDIEDSDELKSPLDDGNLSNDGFDDVVPYIQPVYQLIPFICYEDLIRDAKEINKRPEYIAIEGVIPFKFIRERLETNDEAVVLGFKAPKEKVSDKIVMNFSVNSDDELLKRRNGVVVPFDYNEDTLADTIEYIVERGDDVKTTGLVKFGYFEQPKQDELALSFDTPKSKEESPAASELLEKNIMDNFLSPDNVFSSKDADDSLAMAQKKIVEPYRPKEKWWDDFEFVPGVAKPKEKPVLDYTVSSDNIEFEKRITFVVDFILYEDLLKDDKEINRRSDSIQCTGLVPFNFLERKPEEKESALSLFEKRQNPNDEAFSSLQGINDVYTYRGDAAASGDEEQDSESSLSTGEKWWDDFDYSKPVLRVKSDNPNNPHYRELSYIDDIPYHQAPLTSSDDDYKEVYSGPLTKWWDDFFFIPGEAKEEELVEVVKEPEVVAENPNNPSYAAMFYAEDVEGVSATEEAEEEEDYYQTLKEKEKWWDDFEFVPGVAKPKERPVLNYNINGDNSDFAEKEYPLFPFTYYEDILDNQIEVNPRPDYISIEGVVPFVFLETVPEKEAAIAFAKPSNSNDTSYAELDDINEVTGVLDEEDKAAEDEDRELEKWWDDFKYVQGSKKTLGNPNDKYYNQLTTIDDWDTFSDYLAETKENDEPLNEEKELIKWWDDFKFIPGGAQPEAEEEETASSLEPRIISLIEEEMASSLDIDYPLTIARIDSDKIDEIFAMDYVDVVTFRIDKTKACLVFIALDKKESMDIINMIKTNVDKNLKFKLSELSGRKIDKKTFLAEISA